MTERFSLGGALKAAFGFWGQGVRATAGVMVLATLSIAWFQYIGGMIRDSAPVDQQLQGVALSAVTLIVLFATVAQYRAYFSTRRPDEPELKVGPQGFQIGRPEAAVFIASLLQTVLFLLLGMLLFVGLLAAILAVLVTSGQAPPTTNEALMRFMGPVWPVSGRWAPIFIYAAGAGLLFVWVYVRLSLTVAASVAERQIRVLSTWTLTKGLFWKMLAGKLLIVLPVVLIGLLQTLWLAPLLHLLHLDAGNRDVSAIVLIASAALSVFYQMPLLAGFNAYVYDCTGPTPSPEAKAK